MNLKSHTWQDLRLAVKFGYRLFYLDTGNAGDDDLLYGIDYDDVHADVVFHYDLEKWPAGWTLREIHPAELSQYDPEQPSSDYYDDGNG